MSSLRQQQLKRTNEKRVKALAMFRRGMSSAEIGRELGLSRERICQFLRPTVNPRENQKKRREQVIEEIKLLLRDASMGRKEIAERIGVARLSYWVGPMSVEEKDRRRELHQHKWFGKKIPGTRLTLLKVIGKGNQRQVSCRCDCGAEVQVYLNNVIEGRTKSCGCLLLEYRNRGKRKGA